MGKLGEEMEREPGSRHQPLDLAGAPHLLSPLRRHSGNGTAPPKRQGQAEGLQHSPFFCAMGQKRVLQAWEAAGFWCAEQPTAGRRPARHCTDLVCMPPPQLAVHCGKHKKSHRGHQVLGSAALASFPPAPQQAPHGGLPQPTTVGGGAVLDFSQVWTLGRSAQKPERP